MIEELPRLNELAKIAKERELTTQEIQERDLLRKKYLQAVRGSARSMLLSATIKDREGNDVTPQKLKDEQAKMHRAD